MRFALPNAANGRVGHHYRFARTGDPDAFLSEDWRPEDKQFWDRRKTDSAEKSLDFNSQSISRLRRGVAGASWL